MIGIKNPPKQIGYKIDHHSYQKQTVGPHSFGEIMSIVVPKNILIDNQQENNCQNTND
jgi:hypothetical protein